MASPAYLLDSIGNQHPVLRAGIAISYSHGICEFRLLTESIKVNSDAKWRANFVLPAVAFADITIVVKNNL